MENNSDSNEANKYLIIGGVPKSGTTSLFRYLSDHPEICPANRKETYFFAREFDLKKVCSSGDTIGDFEEYFSHCTTNCIRVEATPYTIYSNGAAKFLSKLLPNSHVVFMLRDPVSRLISDFQVHIQRNHPVVRGSLEDFFNRQFNKNGNMPSLVKMGCYIDFIKPFLKELGQSRVHVFFLEDFKTNPVNTMQNLCNIMEIEGTFYHTYDFRIHNPTIAPRSFSLVKISKRAEPVVDSIRSRLMRYPLILEVFEEFMNVVKSIYRNLNDQGKSRQVIFTPDWLTYLEEYYLPYNDALSNELGRSLPFYYYRNNQIERSEK